jgi:hypothetical protein
VGRNVRGAICPWGELSVGRIVREAKCPWGEMSVGRDVRGASCPWGELSVGRDVVGRVVVGRDVVGRAVVGRAVVGRVVREPFLTIFLVPSVDHLCSLFDHSGPRKGGDGQLHNHSYEMGLKSARRSVLRLPLHISCTEYFQVNTVEFHRTRRPAFLN